MKKILGLIFSRRKLGNSEIVIKELSKQITEPHELRLLRVTELNLNTCRACYSCLNNNDCVISDDLHIVINELCKANAVIIAAPTYFMTTHFSVLQLLGRFLALYTYSDKVWNKPAIAVGIAGIQDKYGSSEVLLHLFLKVLMAEIKGIKILTGAFPGEVLLNKSNKLMISELANSLFGEKIVDDRPKCNICGSHSFGFFENNKVRCLICSNPGEILFEDNKVNFKITQEGLELFLSNQSAEEHRKWLIDMKKKFFNDISSFKKIRDEFSDYGIEINKYK